MCGIAGILGDPGGLDAGALLAALAHRGPDRQAAVQLAPDVWLAATRLAISDPSAAGDQPMSTPEGALTVVHNGELYNAAELRQQLTARGHRFRSRCDTEVLLHGYREWGDALPERLDGMFAFALWDAPRRRLVLARDPLGIKPLWLTRPPGRVVFASEVRALIAARAVSASLAPAALRSFLATGSVAEPNAICRGVEALAPGHRATFVDGTEARAAFWSLPPPAGDRTLQPDEASALVRARLSAAVTSHLEADVPVALLLSGGIDSAALALLAHAAGDRAVRTFHVRVGERAAARAAALAASLGFSHQEITIDDGQVDAALPAFLAAQDQPSVDGTNTFFIARAIRAAGLKAAVTGLGADELFLGYPLHRTYVRARAMQRRLDRLAGPLRGAARLATWIKAQAPPLGGWQLDKLLGLASARGPRALYAAVRALFPAAALAELLPGDRGAIAPQVSGEPAGPAWAAAEVTRLELSSYLVDTLLRDSDVMSMAHGVELRVPMLDRRLVEAVVPIDGTLKLRRGRQKPLLVDAVPELPRELTGAPKEGFELPMEAWLAGPLQGTVEETLRDGAGAARVGLERRGVERVWRRFQARRDRPSAFRVWALYCLYRWAAAHGASAA
ncbi:MAG TPA: asparagine synthase (glutamine-hydrolyzing) [Kofleriaceae bacterium]|nr:asparagine synthase (glutamine-hydrolyzing) [Kofleriaceae bacterium]